MKIAIVASSDKSFIHFFLPNYKIEELPIGYVGSPFIGTLINSLLKKDHEVYAITTSNAVDDDYSIRYFRHEKFTWIVVPCRPHSFRFNNGRIGRIINLYAYEIKQLKKTIIQLSPDVVHAHWSYEFAAAAVKSKLPCLVTVHDNSWKVFCFFKNLYRLGKFIMSEIYLRKVRFSSTVSPYMEEYVKRRCGEVRIIPNPTRIKIDENEVQKLISKRVETIASPQLIMINNGWDERKNGMVGLQAFKIIKEKLPKATLHLFGHGTEENGLAWQDAKKIELEGAHFYGAVTHKTIEEHLIDAHLFIHPSLEESFGVVLIEAMSYGVPAMGGRNSGAVPWVVNNEQLLADIANTVNFSERIEQLLFNPEEYSSIALACYRNTVARFSDKAVSESYEAYYADIIKNF